jgi:magnesium transporter
LIRDGRLFDCPPGEGVVTLYSSPGPQEQRALIEGFGIDEHTLASALDPDEISRLEFDEKLQETFIVWTRPLRGQQENPEFLGLASMGFFLEADYLTIITEDEEPLLRTGDKADSIHNLLLRIMASTVNEFLLELKRTKRASQEIGQKLSRSLENRQFLKMFDLSEGLIYHINALEANGGVLRRLRSLASRLGFSEEEIELLDDVIIDSNQCITQAQTFSTILAGLMDARGNLINNNMNVLLRNLTVINVVFLPLGVIASMGGMSEFSVFLDAHSVNHTVGYLGFGAAMVAIGFGLLKGVNYWINHMFAH